MLKSPLIASLALALASPLALAADKPAAATTAQAPSQGAKPAAATTKPAPAAATARPAVRDWAAIDTNKDNLISPDEMQKHLEAEWAAAKKGG